MLETFFLPTEMAGNRKLMYVDTPFNHKIFQAINALRQVHNNNERCSTLSTNELTECRVRILFMELWLTWHVVQFIMNL